MALEKIGLEAVLQDEQFQAALKRYMQGEQQMRHATDSSTQQQSGAWTFLATAAGAAVGTIVGQMLNNLIPAMRQAAMAGIDSLTKWGEGLDKLSDQFGFSGEDAAKWSVAMRKVGVAPEEGAFQLNYFTRQLDDASAKLKAGDKTIPPFAKSMQKLGVSMFDARGKVKSFNQLMPEIMEGFKKLPQGIESSAVAMDLFGARGGTKFLDFLRQGKAGLEDASKIAKEFGLDLSTDQVNAIEQYGFAWNEVQLKIQGMLTQLGTALFPIFQELVKFINEGILPAINSWARDSLPSLIKRLQDFIGWIKMVYDNLRANWEASGIEGIIIGVIAIFGEQLGIGEEGIARFVEIIEGAKDSIIGIWQNELKPKLDAFKTWMDTDGKQALQTFYDKLVEMKPFVSDWLSLLKDLHESLKDFQTVLQDTNSELDETGNHFNILNSTVSGAMGNLRLIIDTAFGGIRTAQQTWQALTRGDWDGFLAGIIGIFQSAWSVSIPGILTRASQWLGEQMANLIIGMASAIWSNSNRIFDALVAPFRNAIDWIRSNWGWSSPPKIFIELGKDVSKALEIGMGGMNMGKMITQQVMPMTQAAATYNNYNRSSTFINNAPIYSNDYIGSRIDQQLKRWNKGQ